MSEAEFDSYLSLLSKFLRLRSRQRADLADELRDHLDSRLDELLAQGKSREQAVRIALEEFGDAAVLAEDFSRLASRRTRRFVMRCTAASAAVVAAIVLLSIAFAPPGPNGPGPGQIVAQQQADDAIEGAASLPMEELSVEQEAVAALEQKLGEIVPEVKFVETPLADALQVVADAIEADVLIDRSGLEEDGVTPDTPVTLVLQRTPASARTVLEFLLEPVKMTFINRAGVIYITTEARAESHLTTRVYNVRDLLVNATSSGLQGGGLGGFGGGVSGGGFFSVQDRAAIALAANGVGQIGGGGMGGGFGQQQPPEPSTPAEELVSTIERTTSGPWLDIDGDGGTITVFDGLLVVRQSDEVHGQIQKLLDALREADRKQPGDSVTVPKDGAPVPLDEPADEEDAASNRTRDLSLLSEYRLSADARTALLAAADLTRDGSMTELVALRGVTLTNLPSLQEDLHRETTDRMGVSRRAWSQAIEAAAANDRPLDLKEMVDAAGRHAGGDLINPNHLLLALLDRKDGPIPAVLAHVGLTPRGLREMVKSVKIHSSPEDGFHPWPDSQPADGADKGRRASDFLPATPSDTADP